MLAKILKIGVYHTFNNRKMFTTIEYNGLRIFFFFSIQIDSKNKFSNFCNKLFFFLICKK